MAVARLDTIHPFICLNYFICTTQTDAASQNFGHSFQTLSPLEDMSLASETNRAYRALSITYI